MKDRFNSWTNNVLIYHGQFINFLFLGIKCFCNIDQSIISQLNTDYSTVSCYIFLYS